MSHSARSSGWLIFLRPLRPVAKLAPQIRGYEYSPISPEFGEMPYLLIPGVYMPCAVFMHIFSLAQGRENKPEK